MCWSLPRTELSWVRDIPKSESPNLVGSLNDLLIRDLCMWTWNTEEGKSIIESLLEKAKERNISDIQLDVYAENESALKAYKKVGFRPDILKMGMNMANLQPKAQ